jgi:dTDP-4-dehydrorhamnose reductase
MVMEGAQEASRAAHPPEVWAGFECTRVRVNGRTVDQVELTGHGSRTTDLNLLSWLGAKAVRYPILWERIAPSGLRAADWRWADERLAILRDMGIRPIAGLLHHGSGPRGMSIMHPGFAQAFARFATAVAVRYPWIETYLPINEPLTTARFSGLYGLWHPHARSDSTFAKLLLGQALAIRAAMKAIREVRSDARFIVNEDVGRTFGTPELAEVTAFANARRWLTWDLLTGAIVPGHPMWRALAISGAEEGILSDLAKDPSPPDILGVDHYVTSDRYLDHRLEEFPEFLRPRVDQPAYIDVEAVRVAGLPGDGIRRAIQETWDRYGRPIALTEVELAGPALDQALWFEEAWTAALGASRLGVDIRGVAAWAIVGATDWHALLCRREGRYEPGCFDARTVPATPRPAAYVVRSAAGSTGSSERLALDSRRATEATRGALGWWRRPDRFLWEGRPHAA